jgi:hypothetical protein
MISHHVIKGSKKVTESGQSHEECASGGGDRWTTVFIHSSRGDEALRHGLSYIALCIINKENKYSMFLIFC